MSVGAWIAIGAGVLVFLLIIWFIKVGNELIRLKNDIEEGFSTMDVQMKKRYDLIPNLVSTVKGIMKHEKETLTAVIEARNMGLSASSKEEKMEAANQTSGALGRLFALAEAYPELKANESFAQLQSQLAINENEIANSRKYYNAVVKKFNNAIMTFPKSIVANMKHYTKEKMFEAAEFERQNVKVEF